ncbi:MAG: SBBP repeat-containing protein [candidate division WOR-3 bacterium]|nr:MAG: SBBP repeat-containing protein [candidate division WOR-3 bacterium]
MRLLALAITICTAVSAASGCVDTTWVNRHDGPASGDDAGLAIALHPQGVVVAGRHMDTTGQSDFVTMLYDPAGERQWISTYDGSDNGIDEARAVAIDAAGNVYVAGPSQGEGTGHDFVTVKYNSSGVEQWVKRLDYEGNDDSPNALAVDDAGNVHVTGFGRGDATDQDWVTVKYDAGGTEQWRRFHDGDMYLYDEAFGIETDDAGCVYVVGQSSFPGAYLLDYAVIKYSTAGETLFVAEYDGGSYRFDNAYAMVLDDSGNFYVTGRSYGGASYDIVTVKYDAAGDRQWVSRYRGSGTGDDVGRDIVRLGNGDVVVAGYSKGDGTGFDLTAIRYRPESDTAWVRHYNGPAGSDDFGTAAATDPEGNIYVAGHSRNASDNDDILVVKFDGAGNRLWAERYDGTAQGGDVGYGIAVSGSLEVYVTGKSAGSGTGDDFITIRYGPAAGIEEQVWSEPAGSFRLSPVTRGLVTVHYSLPEAGPVSVRVFDIAGRTVSDTRSLGHSVTGSLSVDLQGLSPGAYLVRLRATGYTATGKIVVNR